MEREFGLIKEPLDVLQADVDDESPQVLGHVAESALKAGALDAHLTPIHMKKGRPATRVEILCQPADREKFLKFLLTETTTLGVKARRVDRYSLDRRMEEVRVAGEPVRVKIALLDGQVLRAVPEYEDCRLLAGKLDRPLREILDEARALARRFLP